jgi:hypothetical protein
VSRVSTGGWRATRRFTDAADSRFQPYGKEELLVADIDLAAATGLLAERFKSG